MGGLGRCYATGCGVSANYNQAVEWYRKSIDTDEYVSLDALRGFGDCHAAGHGVAQNWEKIIELYRQAAEMDDLEAQYLLARCYAEGHGGERDMAEAVKLYKKTANNVCENKGYYGHAETMRCLGDCYTNSEGVRKNTKQAAVWYTKAAELESALKSLNRP